MYFELSRWLKYWLWLMYCVKSANFLKRQAMWSCSCSFGIAHRSAESSRVLISGCGFFIICLIGYFVRGISLSRLCVPAFAFSTRYWNTSFRVFFGKTRKAASWWLDWRYACSISLIALSGSSELAFKRLPSWRIWSEYWFTRCIFTQSKSDLSTRCCALSDSFFVLSSSTRRCSASGARSFHAGSLTRSSCLPKLCCFFEDSRTFFVKLLARRGQKTSLWQWNSST